MEKWGNLAALKDETNNTGTYETVYLSTMALSPFLNFSSSPSYRTGLLLLVELIRLAGLEAKTKDWNDEVGAGGSITLLGGGEGAGEPKKAAGVGKSPKRVV